MTGGLTLRKILFTLTAVAVAAAMFTGCSSDDNWNNANEFGEIVEVQEESTNDYDQPSPIDDLITFEDGYRETIKYSSLELFTDNFNKNIPVHISQLTLKTYNSDTETGKENIIYSFNHLGKLEVISEKENIKLVTCKVTSTIEIEAQNIYMLNTLYNTIPQISKKNLAFVKSGIDAWRTGAVKEAPSYVFGNYTVTFTNPTRGSNGDISGFKMQIASIT